MYTTSADLFGVWDEMGIDYKDYALVVSSCGFQRFITKSHIQERPEGRLDYNIVYVVKGKGYFTLNGQFYEVTPGNIFLYPPHVPQYYRFKAEDATEIYWMHISGYAAKNALEKLNLMREPVLYVGTNSDLISQYKKIIRELQLKDHAYEHLTSGYLLELLALFSRKSFSLKNSINAADDCSIKDAINLMHSTYNTTYSAEYYADLCNLSLSRFIHKFKEVTGVSPLEYITNIRIEEAKHLLRNTSYNISEISAIVGYENPLYFSRVFKKATGTSPTEYKKV